MATIRAHEAVAINTFLLLRDQIMNHLLGIEITNIGSIDDGHAIRGHERNNDPFFQDILLGGSHVFKPNFRDHLLDQTAMSIIAF